MTRDYHDVLEEASMLEADAEIAEAGGDVGRAEMLRRKAQKKLREARIGEGEE